MKVIEFPMTEDDTWDDFFNTWREFGKWKKMKGNGHKPGTRMVRIGIRKASNLKGLIVFSYLDKKYPKACGVIRFPLIDLKRLINSYEKSQLVKQT